VYHGWDGEEISNEKEKEKKNNNYKFWISIIIFKKGGRIMCHRGRTNG
jgi:hypothetical protein